MGKVLAYLLGLVLLIAANNIVNSQLVNKFLPRMLRNNHSFEETSSADKSPKLVLLGSSTTKTGFSYPLLQKSLNLTSDGIVNLATMPNNAEINYHLMMRYIEKYPGSIIAYGVDPWIFSERYYDNFNFKLPKVKLHQRLHLLTKADIPLNKKLDILNGGNLFESTSSILSSKKNIGKAVAETDWHGADIRAKVPVEQWFEYPIFGLSQDFVDSLNRLDYLCRLHKCTLLVYSPAYSNSFGKAYENMSYRKVFEENIRKSVKLGVADLTLTTMPDSLFWDGIHVNKAGKEQQSRRLVSIIQSSTSFEGDKKIR